MLATSLLATACGADPGGLPIGGAGGSGGAGGAGGAPPAPPCDLPVAAAYRMELCGQAVTRGKVSTATFAGPANEDGTFTGFNGMLALHTASAGHRAGTLYGYVGTEGFRQPLEDPKWCPGAGVKVVEIADPAAPEQVALLRRDGYGGTSTDYPQVISFGGRDLLAVGLQRCTAEGLAGVDLWDVTDPLTPSWLSFFELGHRDGTEEVCLDAAGRPAVRGAHELHFLVKGARLYLVVSAILREDTSEGGAFTGGLTPVNCGADTLVLDATDPENPARVADWGIRRDAAQLPLGDIPVPLGEFPSVTAHSVDVGADHETLLVSYWDAGLLLLDVAKLADAPGPPQEPFVPQYLGRFRYALSDEGNAHSAVPIPGHPDLVLAADEDWFSPQYGFLRVLDVSDPASPKQLSTFMTANTVSVQEKGWYSAHDPAFHDHAGTVAAVSWIADGARLVDFSDPAKPTEIGYLVPPPHDDPFQFLLPFDDTAPIMTARFAEIGGREYLVASDFNFGLYVMRRALE